MPFAFNRWSHWDAKKVKWLNGGVRVLLPEPGLLASNSTFFIAYHTPLLYLAGFKVEVMLSFRIFWHLIVVKEGLLEESWTQFRKAPLLHIRRTGAGPALVALAVPSTFVLFYFFLFPLPFWFLTFPFYSSVVFSSLSYRRTGFNLERSMTSVNARSREQSKYLWSCRGGAMISIPLELQIEMYLGKIVPAIDFMPQVRRWWEQLTQRKICCF